MGTSTMTPTGQGGARPGSGRPPGYSPKLADKMSVEQHDPFADVSPEAMAATQPRVDFANSRAAVEAIKAKRAELEYRKELGMYVDREAMKAACALVMAQFAQAMRSMQDDMERKLSLAPEVVEAIGEYVDAQLDQLASGFELYVGAKDAE